VRTKPSGISRIASMMSWWRSVMEKFYRARPDDWRVEVARATLSRRSRPAIADE
jgi:hypothetical protein